MENENIVTIQFKFTRDKALLLMALFFLCWHPRVLNSETLTLTTYYPAPYGGYVSLLTTDRTLLARDAGGVGIGMGSGGVPSVKLEVAQNTAIKLGQAYLSSGGDYVHLANNEWYNGGAWTATGQGALLQLTGQSMNFYRHDNAMPVNHVLEMSLDGAGNLNLNGRGNLTMNSPGMLNGVCRTVSYTMNMPSPCGANERVLTWYGNGVQTCGMLFLGGSLSSAGSWTQQVCFGGDRSGTMLCCRIGG